jgi:hypothetical protein
MCCTATPVVIARVRMTLRLATFKVENLFDRAKARV